MKSLFGVLRGHWKILLFAGFFSPLFVYLGFWQLDRSNEKAALMTRLAAASEAPARAFDWQPEDFPESFARLRIAGQFHPDRQVLYDNQIYQGRFGYRVFTPFCASTGEVCLLVERGWTAGDVDRSKLPTPEALAVPEDLIEIVGQADILQAAPLIMENTEAEARMSQWPRRVQMMADPSALLKGFSGESERSPTVLPWVLRMADSSPGALQPFWSPNVMSAAKHTGYALQWFAMALALMALTIWQLSRRDDSAVLTPNLEQKHERS